MPCFSLCKLGSTEVGGIMLGCVCVCVHVLIAVEVEGHCLTLFTMQLQKSHSFLPVGTGGG